MARGPPWLAKRLARLGRGLQSCTLFVRGEPSRIASEVAVVSVGPGWLSVCVEVVFPSLDYPSLFLVPFLFGWYHWIPLGGKLRPMISVVFGNHPCLLPVYLALSEDLRRGCFLRAR